MSGGSADDGEVVVTTDVEASPETVFRFVSDAEGMTQWLGSRALLDPRPGGAFRVAFDRFGTVVEGRVLEIDPPRRVVLSWGVASGPQAATLPPGSTRVTIELEAIPTGTRVTLRHAGLPDEKERRDHEGGWRYYASRFAILAPALQRGPAIERALRAWTEAWNEPDAGRRAELLAECFEADGTFEDEHASVTGREALCEHVGRVQGIVPGMTLRRRGEAQVVRGWLRDAWEIEAPGGGVVARGENVAELGTGSRLRRVVGFAET